MSQRLLACLVPLALVACVDAPDLGSNSQNTIAGIGPGSGDRQNGRHVMGILADVQAGSTTQQYLTVEPSGFKVIRTSTAGPCLALTASTTCAPPASGTVFSDSGGTRARLQVQATVAFTGFAGQAMTGYLVKFNQSWNSGGAPTWVSYCKNDHLAYVLDATFGRDGTLTDPSTNLSFVCSEYDQTGARPTSDLTGNGDAAKTLSYGWLPDGATYQTLGGQSITGNGLYLATLRALHADYCADGTTHTIEATTVDVMDLVPGNHANTIGGTLDTAPLQGYTITPEAASSTMLLESFWGAKGPMCLSRTRWSTLPVGDLCTSGGVLHDPRVVTAGGQHLGTFCEDWPDIASAPGALLAITSRYNDAGLWRWRHATTADHYTTTLGSYAGVGRTDSVLPAPGYDTTTTPLYLGALLTSAGKARFEAAYPTNGGALTPVQSCKKNNDWLTTAPSVFAIPAGYASCKVEGYLWSTPPAPAIQAMLGWTMPALYLYKKTSGADYLTTTAATAPSGYTTVATLGYVVYATPW